MTEKYYSDFTPAPLNFVTAFTSKTGIELEDARICVDQSVILELAVGDGSPGLNLDRLLDIASFFEIRCGNVFIDPTHGDGTVTIAVLEQKTWDFTDALQETRELREAAKEEQELAYYAGFNDGCQVTVSVTVGRPHAHECSKADDLERAFEGEMDVNAFSTEQDL